MKKVTSIAAIALITFSSCKKDADTSEWRQAPFLLSSTNKINNHE